jgi:AcrR family transcriptional regulator
VTNMPGAGESARDGLRERKKARTRASIREHALRLFREHGYQATTVEKIAEAAEVSPSTFFRYFPTKEDVVLQDDMDTRLIEALEQQPPGLGPVAAARAAVRQVAASYTTADMDALRETTALTLTVPEIRARALDELARAITVVAEAVAKRADRPADDLAVRAIGGAIIGVIMAITIPWEGWSEGLALEDTFGRIDEALGVLEAGLPL